VDDGTIVWWWWWWQLLKRDVKYGSAKDDGHLAAERLVKIQQQRGVLYPEVGRYMQVDGGPVSQSVSH